MSADIKLFELVKLPVVMNLWGDYSVGKQVANDTNSSLWK